MGSGRFDRSAYAMYSTQATTRSDGSRKTADEVFTSKKLNQSLSPFFVTRESRDSIDNPMSTPVILGLDVTGSMGFIADAMIGENLGVLMSSILDDGVITDPHILMMAIGDITCDKAPLQVSQFEADIRIAQQLKEIYLEKCGGGNDSESYTLAWYFAAYHTNTDSFTKRGKRGYIFTIGDENPPASFNKEHIRKHFGEIRAPGLLQSDEISTKDLLEIVEKEWDVFHIIIEQGNYARSNITRLERSWYKLLGKRAIFLSDHTKLPDVITSVMKINEGADPESVVSSSNCVDVMRRAIFGSVTSKV